MLSNKVMNIINENINENIKNNSNLVSLKDKLQLKKDIRKLDKQSCITILQFIINHNVKFTDNSNGVFFNLKSLNDKQIKSLIDITNNCKEEIQKKPVVDKIKPIISNTTNDDNLHHSYKKYINNGEDL